MPRSSHSGNLEFDPEIEKTARRLRKETKQLKGEASTSFQAEIDLALDVPTSSDFEEEVMAQNPKRTIKEMTSLDLNQQPLCIEYPNLDVDFELKSGLIHLLPTFRGLAGEDPHKHLKEFHVCAPDCPRQIEAWWMRLVEVLLYDKIPTEARKLITTMAANNQQFGMRNDNPPRKVNEVIASIDERLDEPTSLVKRFMVGGPQQVKACGICTSLGHFTDACPTLHEEPTEHADVVGGFFGQERRHDPFSNTYNPGWRDHPNLRYGNQSHNFQKPPQTNPNPGMPLEDIVKTLALSTQQFQQETRASIRNLESQVSQLAFFVSRLESQGKLPSQTIINPNQNVSAITLCSQKELQFENSTRHGHAQQGKIEDENSVVHGHAERGKTGEGFENSPKQAEKFNQVDEEHPKVFVPKPPFPERFAKSNKEEEEKDILETLRKVEVNILLLDAIKQVPRYAKFLKEMCTNKSKLRGNERVSMGENVSTILQSKLPPKCKDPGTFFIPCQIGNFGIENAMCDLGASINVMPFAIYESLNVGPLKETRVVLQLADRSIVYPKGVLEDVLVQINELVFPADFYVLDMMEDNSPNSTSILLGRPFLKTSRTKIDVDAGILSMEFDNEVVSFYIDGVTQNSNEMHSIFLIDFIDPLVQENAMFDGGGAFKMTINKIITSSPRTYKNKAFHEKISSRRSHPWTAKFS
ncbi:UNVERIFIED_CONTAM: hypothetical protein Slati_2652300 [Sesamum latifolium]|uniref:Retrotransposon gag protein n=1 Tax=Sesamum latifolium TaxID=2727402 RepID=A0AAW2VUR0_9LAMI